MSHGIFAYPGQELEVFAHARSWKSYWQASIRRWVRGDVLEVGAGLGANSPGLQNPDVRTWSCIEPDAKMAERLTEQASFLPHCSVRTGTIADCAGTYYDTILYIDVLEHIEADRAELAAAAQLLRAGGHLIVLSPAHQFLYSEFDASIGHYRRYNKASLRSCGPPGCELSAMFYLDAVGMLTSLTNRLLLNQNTPTVGQIRIWDGLLIPVSRIVDPLFRHRLGKTIVAVWVARE